MFANINTLLISNNYKIKKKSPKKPSKSDRIIQIADYQDFYRKHKQAKALIFVGFSIMLSWRKHFGATIALAIPVCLSNVGHIFVDLTDNLFIGQLADKTTGQAAVGLAGSVYILVLVIAIGVSYGITPIVAEANVKGEHEKIKTHLRSAFIQNTAVAALLLTMLFFVAPLLRYAGKPPEVTELSIRFLNVIMLSMIPLSIFFTCKQFAEGMSDTKAAMFVTIGANLLNIGLNWVLVFGKLGFPEMGVMGSCWATFIARCAMAAGMLAYLWYSKRYRSYRSGFRIGGAKWSYMREQLRIGIPSGLMFAVEVAAFNIPTVFIPDKEQLAAHRVSLTLAAMSYMVSSGLGAAATIRVGHFLGLGEKQNYRRAGFSAVTLSLLFMCFAALIFIVFRETLPRLFNDSPEVMRYAPALLLIGAAFQLFDGTQVTTQGALRGLKDTIVPGWIAFVAYWIIGLPASWIFCVPMGLGVMGVWYGFILGLAAAAAGFLWRFHGLTRENAIR